jgi:hypothetical protein
LLGGDGSEGSFSATDRSFRLSSYMYIYGEAFKFIILHLDTSDGDTLLSPSRSSRRYKATGRNICFDLANFAGIRGPVRAWTA